ncbi:MAG: DUF2851 family protein [Flavobacteriales bacterium AspAUS03]
MPRRGKKQFISLPNQLLKFFRLCPHSFHTIRFSQLATLYEKHSNRFALMMETDDSKDLLKQLSVEANDY